MSIVIVSPPQGAEPWIREIHKLLPDEEILTFPEIGDPAKVEYALVGMPQPGALKACTNLRFVTSILAGVERLLGDRDLERVPLTRVSPPDGDPQMTEYAILHVLRHHRHMPEFAQAQTRKEWVSLPRLTPADRTVGFLGFGDIGAPIARLLRDMGFKVAAWARRPRDEKGIEIFVGKDGLKAFLGRTEILVNLLALTPETENVVNAEALAMLPKGAHFINLGRGNHVVDADLIAALDSGHLTAATLDVFRVEPLPADSAYWTHPKVTVTPHAARGIRAGLMVPSFVENIRRDRAGEKLLHVIDRAAGY